MTSRKTAFPSSSGPIFTADANEAQFLKEAAERDDDGLLAAIHAQVQSTGMITWVQRRYVARARENFTVQSGRPAQRIRPAYSVVKGAAIEQYGGREKRVMLEYESKSAPSTRFGVMLPGDVILAILDNDSRVTDYDWPDRLRSWMQTGDPRWDGIVQDCHDAADYIETLEEVGREAGDDAAYLHGLADDLGNRDPASAARIRQIARRFGGYDAERAGRVVQGVESSAKSCAECGDKTNLRYCQVCETWLCDIDFMQHSCGGATRPVEVEAAIASAASDLEGSSDAAAKAVHKILLPLTPTWDADQRWAYAIQMAQAAFNANPAGLLRAAACVPYLEENYQQMSDDLTQVASEIDEDFKPTDGGND